MLLSDARKMHVPRLLLHLSDVKNSLVGPNATTLKKTQFSAGVGLSGGDTGRVAESGNGLNIELDNTTFPWPGAVSHV